MGDELHLRAPESAQVRQMVRRALDEDLGQGGDITTAATIPDNAQASGEIRARQRGRIAGLPWAVEAFEQLGPNVQCERLAQDGEEVEIGQGVLRLRGPAQPILTGERVALNFLGHLSGIATATADLVHAVAGTGVKICCTRKTLPGLRQLQKYAVRAGGGVNHRFGLFDAVMIKDNHIIAAGGIEEAMGRAQGRVGHTVKIEIEIDTLEQLERALPLKPDIVLLDNMDPDTLRRAVALCAGRCLTEASGNITIATVAEVASTGVDFISSGWLTHSAPNLDLGMDFAVSPRSEDESSSRA